MQARPWRCDIGKPSPPKPPDPKETAAAQTGTNVSTAIANANLGNVNQVTPDGNLSYNQTGSYKFTDPSTGESYDVPTFTATQTLSPSQTRLKSATDAAQINMANLASQQSGFLKDYLSRPVSLDNKAVEKRLFELGRNRLDPMLRDRKSALDASLSGQGIKIGSAAYDRAITNNNQGNNDAYNELLLKGRGQAVSEILAQRNQPINEITALLSGSQVSQPNFVPTSMPSIPTTDYAGLVQDNYAQRLGIYNSQNAQRQQLIGGLFGLGSAFAGNPAMF